MQSARVPSHGQLESESAKHLVSMHSESNLARHCDKTQALQLLQQSPLFHVHAGLIRRVVNSLPRGGIRDKMAPMKVTFKTVQGSKFELDLDSSDMVCDIS